ncbi:MAG: CoA-binding protein [Armatimonadetes bacterium]|nr:CoA-binding protein [Armatimonadota bacterium]MBS1726501.1 CoA-binding protein [Armatimonadota bacterium]
MSTLSCDITLNTKLTPEQREKYQNSKTIQELLGAAKVIAIVGMSTEPTKASNMVGSYLIDEGFTVVPIHPKADEILGQKVYRSLEDVPFPIDIVDVFRPPNEIPRIVEQAIKIGAKAVWTQLRIINFDAAEQARAAGLEAIVDKCVKMEHGRYGGMLHWAGMNTEVISAQRRKFKR